MEVPNNCEGNFSLESLFYIGFDLKADFGSDNRKSAWTRELEPERQLMLAVLEDATYCIKSCISPRDKKKLKLSQETIAWVMRKDKEWIFSFENICESLAIDPRWLRRKLLDGHPKLREVS